MKFVCLLGICLTICLFAERGYGQDAWRGFVPLKTTMREVEKILGPSVFKKGEKPLPTSRWYKTEQGIVNICYSSGRCRKTDSLQWKVAAGIVTGVYFDQPKRTASLTEWGFNVEGYKKEKDRYDERFYYTSPDETLVIQTRVDKGNETVDTIGISPGVKDKHLLCPQRIAPKTTLSPNQPR